MKKVLKTMYGDITYELNDDYCKFCLKCAWLDSDYGCTSPPGEEVYQCPLYMHYHPEEVEAFNKAMEEWTNDHTRDN